MSSAANPIDVEVVFALPEKQRLLTLTLPHGTMVGEAILTSDIGSRFPGIDFDDCESGIWGRPVSRTTVLGDGDRIEIYRPLVADPREARRELATKGQTMGQSLKD